MLNNVHGLLFTQNNIYNLRELTEPRCLSSIPFGGRFRMIDFMLSNLVNAGVSDVGVLLLAKYKSLLDHLGSGKDWDLARHSGGLHSARVMRRHEARSSSKVAASSRTVSRSRMKAVTSRLSVRLR